MKGDDEHAIRAHNREAWNRQVAKGNRWTQPVSPAEVEVARRGELALKLTPRKLVPMEWYPRLRGCDVLGLAAGGGQQGPLLAAAGANVTVFDNAPAQLAQDRLVAERERLPLRTVEGDLADLSAFDDASFDLVFHPVANCFVPDVVPVWREASRVLRPGGILLAGFANPVLYLFDDAPLATNPLTVCNAIPHSDAARFSPEREAEALASGDPLEFGHTLEDQLGAQLAAGLVLVGLYEDRHHWDDHPLNPFIATFMATRAIKG